MNRSFAIAILGLFLASGVRLAAQEPKALPAPPQVAPPGPGLPGAPPGGPGAFPGFPMQTDHKELVAALIEILDDSDADVRASVAQALAKIGHQSVTPVLDILKNKDKSAALRANAAYVLGQI